MRRYGRNNEAVKWTPIQAEASFEEALGFGSKVSMKRNGGIDELSLPGVEQDVVFAHALSQ
jgi:hypothetical protein